MVEQKLLQVGAGSSVGNDDGDHRNVMMVGGGGGGDNADVDAAERRLGDLAEEHEQEHPADATIRTVKEVTKLGETCLNEAQLNEA